MANIKITDLTAYGNPTSTDVLPIVDVGADVTKKISIADLLENAGSGTAAAPGIAFDGDSNTGIYRPGADQLAISTNGTQRLLIEADGDINIDSGGVFYDATNNRLAIGVTGPSNTIDVNGTGRFRLGGTNQLVFTTDGGNPYILSEQNAPLHFGTNNQLRATIDASGRLLFGTSSARTNFDGNTSTPLFQIEGVSAGTASASIVRGANDTIGSTFNLGKTRGAAVGGNTVVSSGDQIGIINFQAADGTNLIDAASIQATVDDTPGANDMPGRLVFSTTADGASTPTERMRITSGGRVMIGGDFTASSNTNSYIAAATSSTSTGNLAFESIAGNTALRYHMAFSNPNGAVGGVTTNGYATAFNTSSDYRLKENVVPLTGAANRVNQLQVHRFNFIADPDNTVDGFLAHEAQAVVPECVTGTKDEVDADGNPVYQGIDQSKLVPLLTAALQEALQKIETLEQRLNDAGIA